jgi:magnesium-dependent phosphatase 1
MTTTTTLSRNNILTCMLKLATLSTILSNSLCVAFIPTHYSSRSSSSALKHMSSRTTNSKILGPYPELLVYDMDACLWDKEMYEMPSVPSPNDVVLGDLNGRGEGVIGVMSGRNRISLHRGSLMSLQEHADGKYPGMKVAFASSADTPFAEKIGRASLKLLEVLPGLTVWDLAVGRDWEGADHNQIGRQPPLSSNKARSHFPRLKKATGIRYDRMLFFDDCNWGDHCGMVAKGCKEADTGMGPATVRTPRGLGEKEWQLGLETYAKHAMKLMEQT